VAKEFYERYYRGKPSIITLWIIYLGIELLVKGITLIYGLLKKKTTHKT
jgi:hypothetical protein